MTRRTFSGICALSALSLCLSASHALRASDGEAERARRGGEALVSNWHLGPFFEYRRAAPDDSAFWAVRPFYSQVRADAGRTRVHDALWPLFTFHGHAGASWWRALVAHGDSRASDPSWSFNVFPLWFSGADRAGEGYWGLFPLYGSHPHFLLMDDLSFVLWPLWHTYTVKDVRSRAVMWPFVTWRDAPREGLGLWPLWGTARLRESRHGYALWPLVTWARYDEDRDTSGAGSSWWALPFYGEVRRARESQTMVLPPFFSYARTDAAVRWRMPWPFVEVLRSSRRDRVSVWPFWERVRGYSYAGAKDAAGRPKGPAEERTWRLGWQLVGNTRLETKNTLERRFSLFPFFTRERRWSRGKLVDDYLRVWPFYSSETVNGLTRRRTLELMPVRHVEGVERNWAPFWSLWESEDRPDGRTRHSVLFNFISWQTGASRAVRR
jgi:hypothetical protein